MFNVLVSVILAPCQNDMSVYMVVADKTPMAHMKEGQKILPQTICIGSMLCAVAHITVARSRYSLNYLVRQRSSSRLHNSMKNTNMSCSTFLI